jgi:acetamidase/formamidase
MPRILALAGVICCALAVRAGAQTSVDHYVPSRPANLVWGMFPVDAAPVLTVKSGQTVRIDTLSHQGATQQEDPIALLARYGVPRDQILQDVLDFRASWPGRPRRGGHILTGPIAIEGAAPGDTIEVQILELETRVPWGMNGTSADGGPFRENYPGSRPGDTPLAIPDSATRHVIKTGLSNGRQVAFFSERIQVPLAPFLGIMAVAPGETRPGDIGVTADGIQTSGPPGPYGGNLDFKALVAGTSLYLPVFRPGALFYTGDPHGVQGDGEVSGNALEQSLTGVFRFVLHKGMAITAPRVETSTDYILLGIHEDLNRALKLAVKEVVDYLVAEKGLTPADALSLSSIAVNFHVAEAVDGRQVIAGKIPKSLFLSTAGSSR